MTDVAQAYVRLRPNLTGFQKDAEAQVSGIGSKLGSIFAVAFGAAAGVELGKEVVNAAEEQQAAISQVRQLTKSAGADWVVYGKTVKENLVDLADESGFTVEDLAKAFARLQPSVKNTAKTLDLLETATETARGRQQDLATVSTALARVQAGQVSGLTRLGITTKGYTAAQDEVKARLTEVANAEKALGESRDGRYSGTIKLTPAEIALTKETDAQRAALVSNLKAQLDSAKASDQQATAQRALNELAQRYKGQNQIFDQTAQGQVARFHESINELEVSLGQALLPTLASVASEAADWAKNLAQSGDVASAVKGTAGAVADSINAIGAALKGSAPALQLFAKLSEEIGPGPILAATAAYYGLTKAQALATVLETKWTGLVDSGIAIQQAKTASLRAELEGRLELIAAAKAEAVSDAATAGITEASTIAQMAQANATYALANAELDATIAGQGAAVANTEVGASAGVATLEVEALTIAELEATAATGGLAAAAGGLLAILTGPVAIVAGIAALVGGLYYLSTRTSETERNVNALTDDMERQTQAAKDLKTAHDAIQADTNALPSFRIQRGDDKDAITKAQDAYDKLALSGKATRAQLARSADEIAAAQAKWRDTNKQIVTTERDKVTQLENTKKAMQEQATAAKNAVKDALKLAPPTRTAADQQGRGQPGLAKQDALKVKAAYDDLNRSADDASKHLTDSQRQRLRDLADYIKQIGKRPTQVEIDLILNTDPLKRQLAGLKGSLLDPGNLLQGGLAPETGARGDRALAVSSPARKKSIADAAKKDATTYTTSFVQTLDASDIANALADSIASAQSNLTSQASSLASAIGDQLDARLKQSTDKLDKASAALQSRIDARSAASQARDSQQASADAALKLRQLQSVLGTGPLTADQESELANAKNAVLDQQDAVANAADAAQQKTLDDRKSVLAQQEELEKTASSRRIADLTDELNRGLISQATYVKGVRTLLDKEQVSYKSAGALLGKAFADGFADSLSGVVGQAKALGLVGTAQLKTAQKGTKPVSPVADEAKAIQAFIDQIAGSGGKFNVKNAGSLPPGVNLASLISAAGQQKAETAYRVKSGQRDDSIVDFTGKTADHTAQILAELRKPKTTVVVVGEDGKKKSAKLAGATK